MPEQPLPSSLPATPFRMTPKLFMLTVAIMLATTMQALDGTIANVALPHMQGSMSAAQDQIAWVLTSYIVATGICTPLTGFLVTRYGRKRLFVFSIVSFTFASMLCGIAQSLEEIVLFRLVQGAVGAFLVPLAQTIIMDVYPKEKHPTIMAAWIMAVMAGPILGPTVGGFLTEFYSWRWAFYINIPVGLVAIIGVYVLLPETKTDPNAKMDMLGFTFIGISIAAFQLILDRGTMLDWFSSGEIVVEAIVAAVTFYLFIAHMCTAAHPFLSRAAFKDTNYVIGLCMSFVGILVAYGTNAILPTMFQSLMGYPALTTGILVMPRGLGMLVSTAITSRLLRTIDPRALILVGLVIIAFMMRRFSEFTLDISDQEIEWTGAILGFGMGAVFTPLMNLTFATLSPQFRTEGAAMYALIRNIALSIGISVDTTLLVQSTQINHAELVGHITPFNHALRALVPAVGIQSVRDLAVLDNEINRQAGMIAYMDMFRLSMYLIIGIALLIPFVRLPKKKAQDDSIVAEA